mmetsp:Transcript_878/g.2387  ORF Transcript_878/g.2387 Transcript_878/m.2387 type:complete len:356 (+) Transcript_878:1978-3045(+)
MPPTLGARARCSSPSAPSAEAAAARIAVSAAAPPLARAARGDVVTAHPPTPLVRTPAATAAAPAAIAAAPRIAASLLALSRAASDPRVRPDGRKEDGRIAGRRAGAKHSRACNAASHRRHRPSLAISSAPTTACECTSVATRKALAPFRIACHSSCTHVRRNRQNSSSSTSHASQSKFAGAKLDPLAPQLSAPSSGMASRSRRSSARFDQAACTCSPSAATPLRAPHAGVASSRRAYADDISAPSARHSANNASSTPADLESMLPPIPQCPTSGKLLCLISFTGGDMASASSGAAMITAASVRQSGIAASAGAAGGKTDGVSATRELISDLVSCVASGDAGKPPTSRAAHSASAA